MGPATATTLACPHPIAQFAPIYHTRDYITGRPFEVGHCRQCQLTVTRPVPPADELARFYPSAYYGRGNRFTGVVETMLDRLYDARADRISALRPVGNVLDIGCGRGLLLNKLRDRGWNTYGTELNDEAAAYARDLLHLNVSTQAVEEARLESASIDLVILWHVLEHLPNPRRVLHEANRVLRPGGGLLVAVPNFGSWEARWSGERWFHLDVPRHLTHFTDAKLADALNMVGLTVQSRSYFSLEFDYFSFVQSAQNALGIRQNLLYNLLRTRSAKVIGRAGRFDPVALIHLAMTFTTVPLLGAVSLAYVPLGRLAGGRRHGCDLRDEGSVDSSLPQPATSGCGER